MFTDASDDAIGHVAYLRSTSISGKVHVAFVSSSSRVGPRSEIGTPRMELCLYMHTDSAVLMGYLKNKDKRFSKYVERRVGIILNNTLSDHWFYVPTADNPADYASRATSVVVVVVVVVGQTVGSISSKTLAYDCLCTLELCTASMIATS